MSEWKDIATAPKEHQEYILLFCPDMGVVTGHWRDEHTSFCSTWNQSPIEEWMISHWMPLPNPPIQPQGEK